MGSIDQYLSFDSNDLSIFQEVQGKVFDPVTSVVYRTNPKYSKSEDEHYRSKIRILNNPFDYKNSIVKSTVYSLNDENGFFQVVSKLSIGDKNCPLFKAWKKLHYDENQAIKNYADSTWERKEEQWVLVQILEDENVPEIVGSFKLWKLPKAVWTKIESKLKPMKESKKAPYPMLDFLIGLPLELDVKPGEGNSNEKYSRDIKYDLCEISADYEPFRKNTKNSDRDVESFFDETELETIDEYQKAIVEYTKASMAKTMSEKGKAAGAKIESLKPKIKDLYKKSVDYLVTVCPDVFKEKGYHEWDSELTARVQKWIDDKNLTAQALSSNTVSQPATKSVTPTQETTPIQSEPETTEGSEDSPLSSLPF